MVRPASRNLFPTMVIGSLPRPRWVQDVIQDRLKERISIEEADRLHSVADKLEDRIVALKADGDEKATEKKADDVEAQKAESKKPSKDPKAEWLKYADSAKLEGTLTFSVTSKLETGWKWTAKDSASALEDVTAFRLNSWLTVPKEEYTVKVSSGER